MKIITTPLDVASDISETIHIYTDDRNCSTTTHTVNELGEYSFECKIEVMHDYYHGDRSTGEQYSFDITGVTVDVEKVYDEEGEEIGITTHERTKIEKLLETNLSFEITKKY